MSSNGRSFEFTPLLVVGGTVALSAAGLLSQPLRLCTFEHITGDDDAVTLEWTALPRP